LAVRLQNWSRLGIRFFNQSVLLRNINDSCERLVALSEALDAVDVIPYYLHQLDKVAGAAHFAVNDDAALRLHREMQKWLPGYLVPRLVREIPGEASKTWL
jgi:L-lysine 2,3-aminomutase